MKDSDGFLFVELTENALTDGRMIDALAAGSFTDMRGRELTITVEDLAQIVANTTANIEATRGESGELLGLPIDRQHAKGESFGYLIGVELAGNILRAAVRWTELGVEAIKKRLLPWFSATLDLQNKVLLGGGLTAWPATRDSKGRILLRPIELSQQLQQIEFDETAEDDETGETAQEETAATDTNTPPAEGQPARILAPTVPAEGVSELPFREDSPLASGEIDMTKDEMSLLVAEQVKAALTAELQQLVKPAATGVSSPGEGEDKNEFDVLALLNMGDTTETVVGAFKEQMLAQYDAMQKRAAQEAAEMVARIKRDSDIAEFTQSVINGNDDVPYGLPVDGKDLQEFLGRLSHADLEFAKNLIGRLHREGRTHFRELGHGRQMQGATQLEPAIKKLLKAHVKAGGDIEEWFAYAGIGEMSQYDLSDFAER